MKSKRKLAAVLLAAALVISVSGGAYASAYEYTDAYELDADVYELETPETVELLEAVPEAAEEPENVEMETPEIPENVPQEPEALESPEAEAPEAVPETADTPQDAELPEAEAPETQDPALETMPEVDDTANAEYPPDISDIVNMQIPLDVSPRDETEELFASMFDFSVDPYGLIEKTNAVRYGGGRVEPGARVIFKNHGEAYDFSSHSDPVTLYNLEDKAVSVTAVMQIAQLEHVLFADRLDSEQESHPYLPTLYLALIDEYGNRGAVNQDGIAVIQAEIPAGENGEASAYSFRLWADCNTEADWSNVDVRANLAVTWVIKPISAEEEEVLTEEIPAEEALTEETPTEQTAAEEVPAEETVTTNDSSDTDNASDADSADTDSSTDSASDADSADADSSADNASDADSADTDSSADNASDADSADTDSSTDNASDADSADTDSSADNASDASSNDNTEANEVSSRTEDRALPDDRESDRIDSMSHSDSDSSNDNSDNSDSSDSSGGNDDNFGNSGSSDSSGGDSSGDTKSRPDSDSGDEE